MGWLSKILHGAEAVGGLVAAPFTGGATIPLAMSGIKGEVGDWTTPAPQVQPQGQQASNDPLGGYGSIVNSLMNAPTQSTSSQTNQSNPGQMLQELLQMTGNLQSGMTPIPQAPQIA